jgi:hypothetical protein
MNDRLEATVMKRFTTTLGPLLCLGLLFTVGAQAVVPSAAELEETREWVGARFEGKANVKTNGPSADANRGQMFAPEPPFSFVYGGRPSSELLFR